MFFSKVTIYKGSITSSISQDINLLREYSADQLAQMLQTKLDEQASENKVPFHFNFHQPTIGTRDQRRDSENDGASVFQDESKTTWQESSNKAILRRRLGIGPELDRETQNRLSRTIRSMISHTCDLSLKETYTSYQNAGTWDDAVKRMLNPYLVNMIFTNLLIEVLAHPMAVKAKWSWPLVSSVMKDIITQSRSNANRKMNAKLKKEGHVIKSGRRRLDATPLPHSPMDLSIPVAPTLPRLPDLLKKNKEKLHPLQEQTSLNAKLISPYSIQGSASSEISSPETLKAPSVYSSLHKSNYSIENSHTRNSKHEDNSAARISSKGPNPVISTKGISSIYIKEYYYLRKIA